jgi:hypothetical protein
MKRSTSVKRKIIKQAALAIYNEKWNKLLNKENIPNN